MYLMLVRACVKQYVAYNFFANYSKYERCVGINNSYFVVLPIFAAG